MFRALVTLQGALELLAPGFQILDEARIVGAELLQEAMAAASLRTAATDEILLLLGYFSLFIGVVLMLRAVIAIVRGWVG